MKSIVFNHIAKQWVIYTQPIEILQANTPQEVVSTLTRAEEYSKQGYHAVGFCSYESAVAFDCNMRVHQAHSNFPLCYFAIYDDFASIEFPEKTDYTHLEIDWHPSINLQQYQQAIAQIKQHLLKGDCYQINFTYRLRASFNSNPLDYFFNLIKQQKTALGAYLETPEWAICSASPELFFQLDNNTITARPMKGTAPRGRYLLEDEKNRQWLQQSEKNRAENTMIVDMIRNDLGKIADKGSVQVNSLHTIEKYQTALQMTSSIQATTSQSVVEIFKAMFPCASITGAPKVKTMETIQQLETEARKIYTGSIGYILPDRQAKFNVAIRTVLIDKIDNTAEFGIGGGIVWDSESKEEYQESLIKAKLLSTARKENIELLETMLWEKNQGIFLLSEHLQRLQQSAQFFSFNYKQGEVEKRLQELVNDLQNDCSQEAKIIRLIYNAKKGVMFEVKALNTLDNPIKICLSKLSIDSSNWQLFHKTTDRKLYHKAFALALNKEADDVIMLNERDEVTETTRFNIVIEKQKHLLTPTLNSGLLNGTYRNSLLTQGKIREAKITMQDLQTCEQIYLINSVRKWQKAILIE